MGVIAYVKALKEATTDEQRVGVLRKVPKDSDLWYALTLQWRHGPYGAKGLVFGPNKHDQYGIGVNQGLFERLIKAMENDQLTGDNLIKGFKAFSEYCTKQEWEQFYMPLLQGKTVLPMGHHLTNRGAPKEYRIQMPPFPSRMDVREFYELKGEFKGKLLVQPFDAKRELHAIWVIQRDYIYGYNEFAMSFREDQFPEDWAALEKLRTHKGMFGFIFPMCLGVNYDNTGTTVRDFFLPTHPMTKQQDRFDLFRNDVKGVIEDHIDIAELQYCFSSELEFYLDMFLQQGYQGMTVRLDEEYPAEEILFDPTDIRSITCTSFDINPDKEIERIHGETHDGIKVTVQSGLKNSTRSQLYEERETLVGSEFWVRSCGLVDGKLLFPIFHKEGKQL